MPDVLVKPTRHLSPVADRRRQLSVAGLFLSWRNEKSVRFAAKPEIKTYPGREDYSKDEKGACWYLTSEYRRMKLTRNLAEKLLGKGKPLPEDEDVACGLESLEDSELRAICSVQSVRSVLIEQEIQKWETEGDPHSAIADVYFHSSFASRLDARERAVRLEAVLMPGRWMPETEHSTSSHGRHWADGSGDAPTMPIREESVRGPSSGAPAMPIREESIRGSVSDCGLGSAPVRLSSFSDLEGSCSESEVSESEGGDLDVSFHTAPPGASMPRVPERRSSIGSASSDDDSWASAQRAASTMNLAGSLAI